MKIFRQADQVITKWAGGQTRQLYIYPESSLYAQKDFDLRISTATIEIENSDFTALPGYVRQLMVLEGELQLQHENHHLSLLKKFDIDHFSGDWKTTSQGLATDFNVISKPGYDIEMTAYRPAYLSEKINEDASVDFLGIYIYKGVLELTLNGHTQLAQTGDFVLLEDEACRQGKTLAESDHPLELILVSIGRLRK